MASPVFDWICTELEGATSLNQLEARGTVRIALQKGGLDARSVTSDQMKAVLEQVLPDELDRRSVDDGVRLCAQLAARISSQAFEDAEAETAEQVFSRLARRD